MKNINKWEIVESFIGQSPNDFALERYGEEYADILNNKMSNKIATILKTCGYQKDKRTILEYAQDIIYSWIIEDYIVEIIEKKNPKMKLIVTGCDKNRKFLEDGKITHKADYNLIINDEEYRVELVVNYTDFWARYGKCHLRDNKLQSLITSSKTKPTLILGLDLLHNKYFLVKVHSKMNYEYIHKHRAFGFKSAYEINVKLRDFNGKLIIQTPVRKDSKIECIFKTNDLVIMDWSGEDEI